MQETNGSALFTVASFYATALTNETLDLVVAYVGPKGSGSKSYILMPGDPPLFITLPTAFAGASAITFTATVYGDPSLPPSVNTTLFGIDQLVVSTALLAPPAASLPPPPLPPASEPPRAPTHSPTAAPTAGPTSAPTSAPTDAPTSEPTSGPTVEPPTAMSTAEPTSQPTSAPAEEPTAEPSAQPTAQPAAVPTAVPSSQPTQAPAGSPPPPPLNVNSMPANTIVPEGTNGAGMTYGTPDPSNNQGAFVVTPSTPGTAASPASVNGSNAVITNSGGLPVTIANADNTTIDIVSFYATSLSNDTIVLTIEGIAPTGSLVARVVLLPAGAAPTFVVLGPDFMGLTNVTFTAVDVDNPNAPPSAYTTLFGIDGLAVGPSTAAPPQAPLPQPPAPQASNQPTAQPTAGAPPPEQPPPQAPPALSNASPPSPRGTRWTHGFPWSCSYAKRS